MSALRTALIVGGLFTTLAAQGERASWPVSKAPAELKPAISRADLVIVTLQDAVVHQLNDEMARGGRRVPWAWPIWTWPPSSSGSAGRRASPPA